MTGSTYLTPEGATRLKVELEELRGAKRRELARRLRSAVQMGDLSENADYHKAKEDQAFLEGRIQEIEHLLRDAVIIEKNGSREVVGLGHHVTIQEGDLPAETYHIVGAKEADPRNGKISNESPIGQAMVDHRIGDSVQVQTPSGNRTFRILKIE
jgi:transcription elongation factor GreA